jgi:hypothetical protein
LTEFQVVWSGVCARHRLDRRIGFRITELFVRAGIGPPDDIDVSGFLPFSASGQMLAGVYRSVLPLAFKYGLTTVERSERFLYERENPSVEGYFLWPLLISAWKRKPIECAKNSPPIYANL